MKQGIIWYLPWWPGRGTLLLITVSFPKKGNSTHVHCVCSMGILGASSIRRGWTLQENRIQHIFDRTSFTIVFSTWQTIIRTFWMNIWMINDASSPLSEKNCLRCYQMKAKEANCIALHPHSLVGFNINTYVYLNIQFHTSFCRNSYSRFWNHPGLFHICVIFLPTFVSTYYENYEETNASLFYKYFQ